MGTEIELKYSADPATLAAIREAVSGAFAVTTMRTTYYDTGDEALSARRCTLRHRQENDRHICTLKTPAGRGIRGEWEVECGDIRTALPRLAEDSGWPELLDLTRRGLSAGCGARFTRLSQLIVEPDFTAELALDQGELLNADRSIPLAEVELELKSGDREAMERYCAAFALRFGLTREFKSKFARAKWLGMEETYV